MNHTLIDINDEITQQISNVFYIMYGTIFLQFGILCYKTFFINKVDIIDSESDFDTDSDSDDDDDIKKDEDNETKIVVKYEDKYMEQFNNLSTRILDNKELDLLKNSYLMEMTPLGNVIMFWNNDRGTFTFYADSTIPYRFLEVVSRKYVVQNKCKQLYIIPELILVNEMVKPEATTNDKPSVFAKLKKYNNNSIQSVKVLQTNTVSASAASAVPSSVKNNSIGRGVKTRETNNMYMKDNANRYSCEGKIVNFSFLKKEKKIGKNISFAEYKKQFV